MISSQPAKKKARGNTAGTPIPVDKLGKNAQGKANTHQCTLSNTLTTSVAKSTTNVVPGSAVPEPPKGQPVMTIVPSQWLTEIKAQLSDIQGKFSKIDILEQRTHDLSIEIGRLNITLADYEKTTKYVSESFDGFKDSIKDTQNEIRSLQKENKSLRNEIADLQCRSMKDNLLFKQIPEMPNEDTENVVQSFIQNELKIPEPVAIEVAHRYGSSWRGGPRPIVVKFGSRKDKNKVQESSKSLRGTRYQIHEQYPKIINDRRRVLYPYFKLARQNGKKASLNKDVLRIDGIQYTVDNIDSCPIKPAIERLQTNNTQMETPVLPTTMSP